MDKVFVVKRLTEKLWSTEAAVDAALAETSQLNSDIIQSRTELKVASTFAGEINVKLLAAMQALTEAREAMAAVHAEMDEAKLRLGVRTKMELLKPVKTGKIDEEVTMRGVG